MMGRANAVTWADARANMTGWVDTMAYRASNINRNKEHQQQQQCSSSSSNELDGVQLGSKVRCWGVSQSTIDAGCAKIGPRGSTFHPTFRTKLGQRCKTHPEGEFCGKGKKYMYNTQNLSTHEF